MVTTIIVFFVNGSSFTYEINKCNMLNRVALYALLETSYLQSNSFPSSVMRLYISGIYFFNHG